jgi:uncharacterized protein YndB with AHSA1/START domain
MIKVDHNTIVNAPVAKVFAFIAAPKKIPQWRPDVKEVFEINGTGKTKTTYKEKVKNFGVFKMEVTEYSLNKKLVVKAIAGPQVRPTQTLVFEPVKTGTKISIHVDAEVGAMFKLMQPLLPKLILKNWQKYFRVVKDQLE